MSDIKIPLNSFPSFDRSVRAKWAPVLLEPISGSMERLVIAVAVVNATGFHVESANALRRLECFYADDASGVQYAIEIAIEHLKRDLSRRAVEAISRPEPAICGVVFGECRDAEGVSLEAIGVNWMQQLSSLYRPETTEQLPQTVRGTLVSEAKRDGADRLPELVMDYISEKRASYRPYFSLDLREGKQRRFQGRNHHAIIDFSGSKIVASFGTLNGGRNLGRSVDTIKKRLWDLKIHRDRNDAGEISRQHEMLIQKPTANDPQFSSKQIDNVRTALSELEAQADLERMRLVALPSVEAIGERVIRAEAA